MEETIKNEKINNKKKKMKLEKYSEKSRGITLIVLVVTIAVLLILAGVTIAGLTGNKGIIKEAQNVKEQAEIDALEEQIEMSKFQAEQKYRNPSLDNVIEEIIKNEVIKSESQVNKETGAIETDLGYTIEGKLNNYLGIEEEIKPGSPEIGTGIFKKNDTINGGEASASNPTIPKGFKPVNTSDDPSIDSKANWGNGESEPSEQALKSGLVIQGKDGSQFVWIPVPIVVADQEADGTNNKAMAVDVDQNKGTPQAKPTYRGLLYDFTDGNGGTSTSKVVSGCTTTNSENREPAYLTDYDGGYASETKITQESLQGEYDNMIKSVMKYGGFYVGRYEMSLAGLDTSSVDDRTAQSKANVKTASAASNELKNWYGLYAKAKTYANEENTGTLKDSGVISSMIWGSQYDAMLNWMQQNEINVNSATAGGAKYNDSQITGKDGDEDKINNIYDLLGCNWEWTLEAGNSDTSWRVDRGGNFNPKSSYLLSRRGYRDPTAADSYHSIHFTLYVK